MPAFYNQATLTYNDIITTSNIVRGDVVDTISISKSAISASFTTGGLITYSVSLVNCGENAQTGLAVSDDLGAYAHGCNSLTPLSYVAGSLRCYCNGVLQSAPTVTAGPPMIISGLSVPAGGSMLLIYSVRANQYAPLGLDAQITSRSILSGPCVSAPLTASACVPAQSGPNLAITKHVCPSTVIACDPLTYTIVIQNSGNCEASAEDNVTISDVFDPILNITQVRLDGELLTPSTHYAYDDSTGEFVTAPGLITVPAASCSQDMNTGAWTISPGTAVLTITGYI